MMSVAEPLFERRNTLTKLYDFPLMMNGGHVVGYAVTDPADIAGVNTFKELARQTGFDEKSLHRMLGRRGNPTARTLAVIIRAIREDLGVVPRVTVAAA
jgi:DNA-binding phage protein